MGKRSFCLGTRWHSMISGGFRGPRKTRSSFQALPFFNPNQPALNPRPSIRPRPALPHPIHHSGTWNREECIILATRGTGGKRRPELRASPKLLEISPSLLPGALVVRQTTTFDCTGARGLEDEANGGGQAEAFRLPGKTKRGYMGRHSSHALSSFVGTPKDKALSSYVSDRYLHGCSANSAHQFVPLSRRYLLLSRHKAQRNKTFEVYGTRLSHSGSFGSRK